MIVFGFGVVVSIICGQPAAAAGGAARGFLILIFEMVTTPQHHRYSIYKIIRISIYYVAVGRGHKYHSKEVAVKKGLQDAVVPLFWRYLVHGPSRKTRQTRETTASCYPALI